MNYSYLKEARKQTFCQKTEGKDPAMLCTSCSVEDFFDKKREIVQTDDKAFCFNIFYITLINNSNRCYYIILNTWLTNM